jgi:hypothetical protein
VAKIRKKLPTFEVWLWRPSWKRLNGIPCWTRFYWDSGITRYISVGPLRLVWHYKPQDLIYEEGT